MESKLNLKLAIAIYNSKNKPEITPSILGGMLWPDLRPDNQQVQANNLIAGRYKKMDILVIKKLCKIFGMSPTQLFNL